MIKARPLFRFAGLAVLWVSAAGCLVASAPIFGQASAENDSGVISLRDEMVGDDISWGPDESLYTTHYGGTAIRRIHLDGKVEVVRDGMKTLGAIAVDPADGTIFVTNYDEGWVMSLGQDGSESRKIAGRLPGPAGIEVARDGSLLVAANQAHAIVRLRRDGVGEPEVLHQGPPLDWPTGFTEGDDGTLWIANMFRAEIVILPPDGEPRVVAQLPRGEGQFQLGYLDAVGDRVYVAHLGMDAVYEVSKDGTVTVVAGGADDPDTHALFEDPGGVVASPDGRFLYVTVTGESAAGLRRIELPSNSATTDR